MNAGQLPAEYFSALEALPGIAHGFTLRVPGVAVSHDKQEALARLDGMNREIRRANGLDRMPFVTAEQVHGNLIGVLDSAPTSDKSFAGCDGVITNKAGVCLGIYVADCCAVYLVDPARKAIGLVHSGKKGTDLGIVQVAIRAMTERFGSSASDLIAQLSPCIRPPHYEIDFARAILRQCREIGVASVQDRGVCTACDLARYYSYRAEKGRTGRMLAFLALNYSGLSSPER